MKALKIVIIAAVIIGVAAFLIVEKSSVDPIEDSYNVEDSDQLPNPFVKNIEAEIETLKNQSNTVFTKDLNDKIQYLIEDAFNQELLGNNSSLNKQQYNNLTKNLYAAYTYNFIEEAKHVLNGNTCVHSDFVFITNEAKRLAESDLLETDSMVNKELTSILTATSKYFQITNFINQSKNFRYSSTSLQTEFPVDNVIEKIERSRNYLRNNLENKSISNCNNLKNQLRNLPEFYFLKHKEFLVQQIESNKNLYKNYESQAEYSKEVYTPLRGKVNELDNSIYKIANNLFTQSYNDLINMIDNDNSKALDYFKKQWDNSF